MKNQESVKLFAFKLAEKQSKDKDQGGKADLQWKVRDGVAIAGCSGEDYREAHPTWGQDVGIWC